MGSGEKLMSCVREKKVWVGKGTHRVYKAGCMSGAILL